jgi:UDP-glucose 4-epimerase
MHVLVTGATGFIGLHLCEALLTKGFKVSGISRSVKSIPTSHVPQLKELDMYHCDISNEKDLVNVVSNIGAIDGIFHLAGRTYMRDSPGANVYFQNNFLGTLNVLECCRVFGIKKLIYSSSYAVYGLGFGQNEPKYLPVDEMHVVSPYDFYDASKLHAEKLCQFYHERYGIIIPILRYSKIYGPGLEEGVVFELIRKALSNLPIEVLGDISTDFVFISDIVNANLASFEKASKFEVYNIGSGQECTLYELCSRILKITKSQSEQSYSKTRSARFSMDISKAKSELNYDPVTLEEGLIKYVEYIRKYS